MVRLYRKGRMVDAGSSWFNTIRESLNYQERSGEGKDPNEEVIGIIWLTQEAFNKYYEARGIGYRAKDEKAFLNSTPVIQYLSISKLEEYLENPVTCKFYGDAETTQRLGFP